jgi:hypothetical protein
VFASPPTFLTLWYQSDQAGASAQGEFPWIYSDFMTGLQNFYDDRPLNVKLGVGYPGFNTFYVAGGWGPGPGWTLPYNGTSTFSGTLQLALSSGTAAVQLATWNDYGEGTMIEPTREFGYGFLTTLQQTLGVGYSQTELELVNTLFTLRKQYAGNASMEAELDQASSDLANCQVTAATGILNGGSGASSGGSSSSNSGSSSGSGGSGSGSSGGGTSSGTTSVCDGAGTRVLTLADAFIDDFEEATILSGWSTQVAGGACGTAHSGEYAGTGAITVMAGGFGVGTLFNEAINPAAKVYCVDISAFDGVSFWAKSATAGSTVTVNFVLPSTNAVSTNSMGQSNGGDCVPASMECYNHPRATVTLAADWTQYTVKFSAASGGSAPVGNVIQEIGWLSPDATWDFSLDEIAFYKGTPPPGAIAVASTGTGGGSMSGSGSGNLTSSGATTGAGSATGGAATTGSDTSNATNSEAGASPSNGNGEGSFGSSPHGPSGCGCTVVGPRNDIRSVSLAIGLLLGCGARRRRARR